MGEVSGCLVVPARFHAFFFVSNDPLISRDGWLSGLSCVRKEQVTDLLCLFQAFNDFGEIPALTF